MKIIHKFLLTLFLSLTFSVPAWADEDNECGILKVQIANGTHHICYLVSSDVVHGNLMDQPPAALIPGQAKRFAMSQTLYGPHIVITYRCEGNFITITSQQNYCFLEAGNITGNISPPYPKNISVNSVIESGSYYWSKPGMISWIFSST